MRGSCVIILISCHDIISLHKSYAMLAHGRAKARDHLHPGAQPCAHCSRVSKHASFRSQQKHLLFGHGAAIREHVHIWSPLVFIWLVV